jgi:hypothetical protein
MIDESGAAAFFDRHRCFEGSSAVTRRPGAKVKGSNTSLEAAAGKLE